MDFILTYAKPFKRKIGVGTRGILLNPKTPLISNLNTMGRNYYTILYFKLDFAYPKRQLTLSK